MDMGWANKSGMASIKVEPFEVKSLDHQSREVFTFEQNIMKENFTRMYSR